MPLQFPTPASLNQIYTNASGKRWKFNGTIWNAINEGIQGTQGIQGIQGTQGTQGTQGIQGIQGTAGFVGSNGAQGTQGQQGIQGIQGIQGTQGAQGLQGIQGIQGTQGTQGIQGIQGTQGAQGLQGVQGIQGTQGTQGIQGIQGITGLAFTIAKTYVSVAALTADTAPTNIVSGQFALINTSNVEDADNSKLYLWNGSIYIFQNDLSGTAGIQGITGSTGAQGTQGIQGRQGITGAQGTQGIQGLQGITGAQGTQGTQGIQGLQGITGAQGITGSTGAQGTVGTTGSTGAQGITGSTGSTGAQGTVGTTGAQGTVGTTGAQGTVGTTGSTGAQGTIGTSVTGAQGTQGISGASILGTTNTFSGANTFSSTVTAANFKNAYQSLNLDTVKTPGLYHYDGVISGTQPAGTSWYNVKTIEIGDTNRYSQIVMPYSADRIFYRRQNDSAAWGSYVELLHSGNYNNYSPTLTGGNASGTWGINITGNAANITAYTINQSVGSGNSPTFQEVYANGWFRNVSTQGLYNGSYGHHFYATSDAYWNIAGNSGSVCSLIMRTGGHQGTIRGYLYSDSSNNVGLLNSAGSWTLQMVGGDYGLFNGSSARAPLFYDSNDTNYYCDPAGTTRLNTVNIVGDLTVTSGGTSSNIYFADTDEGTRRMHCNSNRIGFLNDGNSWGSYCADGGEWYSDQSVRSPIFYDSNDTGYYCDPNGTSNLSSIIINGGSSYVNGVMRFRSNNGGYAGSIYEAPLSVFSDSNNAAYMSFHKGGQYAVNFGLDADNVMRIGGWSASSNRWQLDMSGNMTVAGNVTAYSDIRVKDSIRTINNALNKVTSLRGVYFTRKDQDDKTKIHTGVIAQEVELVLPEVVSEDNESKKNVAYGNMVGLLIEAIKEQQQQIEKQQSQIDELKLLVQSITNK